MRDVRGKVAVVTGGASGIGRSMAACFAAEGMHVVIADVEEGALRAAADELGVDGVRCDVSSHADVLALRDEVVARHGTAHLVCNNAGVGGGGRLAESTLRDWQWVLGVNLWGVVHGLDAFLPLLLSNPDGGHVVNTASMAGLTSPPNIGVYNASKHAVVAISETLRAELAEDGSAVGVSVLCPGYVRTNIFSSQRNRPEVLRNESRKGQARTVNAELAEAMEREAQSPDAVARTVLDAVRAGRFWIITHPDLLGAVAQRTEEILAAGGAAGAAGQAAEP